MIGKGNVSLKQKARAKARYRKMLKERIGPNKENECCVISRAHNLKDSTLDETMMKDIYDYLVQYKNKVAIQDRSTKE